jgi:hypothetical protein
LQRDQETQREREKRALDKLAKIRERIQVRHGILDVDLVAEVREERDRDNERVWRAER